MKRFLDAESQSYFYEHTNVYVNLSVCTGTCKSYMITSISSPQEVALEAQGLQLSLAHEKDLQQVCEPPPSACC